MLSNQLTFRPRILHFCKKSVIFPVLRNICQLYIPLTQPINRFLSPVVSYMSPIYKKQYCFFKAI